MAESKFWRSRGREFQRWGAKRLKSLLPIVLRQAEGQRCMEEEEEELREGRSDHVVEVRQIWRGEVMNG